MNICLVPEWRVWRWPTIRRWRCPSTVHGSPPTVYLPVFYLPLVGRSINWWFYARALRCTFSKFVVCGLSSAVSRPMVLASWLYPDAVAAARLARELSIPVWLRVHGTDRYHLKNRYRRGLILDAVDYAQGVICNCKAVADDLVKWGVPVNKLHIIPNGVDIDMFHYRSKEEALRLFGARNAPETPHLNPLPQGERKDGNQEITPCFCSSPSPLRGEGGGEGERGEETNNRSEAPPAFRSKVYGLRSMVCPANGGTILFVGNLVPVKGPDVMLRAFAAMDEKLSSCQVPQLLSESPEGSLPSATQQPSNSATRLLIIGSGPMRAQLQRLAKDLNVADRVHFLGTRRHAEVALWMNLADVLCLTSRSEGMPNVVVEALASGLPVVATAVGACPELLGDEPAATVCPSGDTGMLCTALRDVLAMEIDRGRLAEQQAKRTSWRRQAETMLTLVGSRGDS
ncbi:MAG: glycosyltransferase [bacterium]